ncbi:MAG: tetratricopeptide repeat protein [Candidatus Omnitrophota bacterium]
MKKFYLIIALIVSFVLNACSSEEYSAEKLYWRANQQYNRVLSNIDKAKPVDFQKVIVAYREIIVKYPNWQNTAQAYFNISRLYVSQKKYDMARSELEKMKSNFYRQTDICANAEVVIALTYEEEGRWDKALEYLDIVEKEYTKTYSAFLVPIYKMRHYKKTGEEDLRQKTYKDAILKYKEMISQSPDTIAALAAVDFSLAAFAELRDKEEALAYLDGLIKEYPSSPIQAKALFSKSIIYRRSGQPDLAIESLEEIVKKFVNTELAKLAKEQINEIKKEKDN